MQTEIHGETKPEVKTTASFAKEHSVPIAIVFAGLIAGIGFYAGQVQSGSARVSSGSTDQELAEKIAPSKGVELPVTWNDLGKQLVNLGVIDTAKMEGLYARRGGFSQEYKTVLLGNSNKKLVINRDNAGYLLNLFWALGLGNKNPILADKTEMMNPAYGGAGNFASTGGWTIAKGDAMSHYNMHPLVPLTDAQQKMVDRVSRNIYRPCCGNATHFPDCNHGMAMLGLLELMASQGVSENDMYKAALAVNSYWFPDTYMTIATYMQQKGVDWKDVSPKEMLGVEYSSAQGFQNISSRVNVPSTGTGSGGCGVDARAPAAQPKQQSGCGA